MSIAQLAGAAVGSILQRTYLLEKGTFNLIPRVLIVFDAIVEEAPEFSSLISQHPVEDGPEVTDHIQLKNPTLSLKGHISNTPTDLSVAIANIVSGGIQAVTSSQFRENFLNTGAQQAAGLAGAALMGSSLNAGSAIAGAIDAIARSLLLDAWQRKARFDVVTKRQRYEGMVIETLRMPRNPVTGYQVYFELELVHLRIVSPLGTLIGQVAEDVVTSASSDVNMGGQAGITTSDQTAQSFAGSFSPGAVA